MKKFLISFLMLNIAYQAFSSHNLIIDQTDINEVKVFFQGAEISRTFSAMIPRGKTEIRLVNLSSIADPQSIVVSSSSSVKIISLHHELDYEYMVGNDNSLKEIMDSIESVQQKINYKELQREALEEEKNSLLKNSIRIGGATGLSIADMDQASAYIRKKQEEINLLLLQTQKEKNKLSAKLENLKSRKEKAIKIDSATMLNIYVLVESTDQQKADFKLSYYVKSCGWAPTYNVYAQGVGKPIELDYKANILNNSGENWDKVKLKLLAGNPSRSLVLPSLETWVLSYRQNKRNGKVYGYNGSGNEGELSKKQIKNGQEVTNDHNVELQEIEVEEGDMTFSLAGIHSIPSGPKEYLADINRASLDASYLYKAIPKVDASAYLVAKVNNWEKLRIIEGPANVFMNETYIGKTYLDPLSAGDTLELSLGQDPGIQITRVKKKDFSTRKLIGLQLVENFSYEIDVRNLNGKAIAIEVYDQIPIAQQEEIQISLEEGGGCEHQPGNGKLTWKLEIPASQTVKLKMGYNVKFPRDKVVIIKRTGRVICPKFRT